MLAAALIEIRTDTLPKAAPGHDNVLAASEATIDELRNVHLPHDLASLLKPQPLSRFGKLRILTLCRVVGYVGGLAMASVLRQLPTSLEVCKCVEHMPAC